MTEILIPFASLALQLSGVPRWIVYKLTGQVNLKPFTCAACVSFWFSVYNCREMYFEEMLLISLTTFLATSTIEKIYNKL
jgi:hypothetical protein